MWRFILALSHMDITYFAFFHILFTLSWFLFICLFCFYFKCLLWGLITVGNMVKSIYEDYNKLIKGSH